MINYCTPTKIRSNCVCKFGSNKKKSQINKKWAISTGDGKIFFPKRKENNHCVFAAIGLENPDTIKICTDLTGRFQVTSNRGIQYLLIIYAYDTNAILVEPIKTGSDTDMLRAYDVLYYTLENLGQE